LKIHVDTYSNDFQVHNCHIVSDAHSFLVELSTHSFRVPRDEFGVKAARYHEARAISERQRFSTGRPKRFLLNAFFSGSFEKSGVVFLKLRRAAFAQS
jgi:hypothetical protein